MFKKLFFLFLVIVILLSACGTLEVSLYRTPTPIVPTSSPTMRSSLILPTETRASATSTPAATGTLVSDALCNRAEFIIDVSVLDGTKFRARESFTKTWRLKNIGTCSWTHDYVLAFMTGEAMTSTHEYPLMTEVFPGEIVNLSVEMTAPKLSGKHAGYWGIKNPAGVWMPVQRGHNNQTFTVEIVVEKDSEPATPALAELPSSLYYLRSVDSQTGMGQVYRLAKDGTTNNQITTEIEGVTEFDVSPVDGSLIYRTGRELVLVDSNGDNRRVLAGSVDPWLAWPRWSPDGQTIAYSNNGIYFYAVATEEYTLILEDDESNKYSPRDFSPDGSKLLIYVKSKGSSYLGIYTIASHLLLPLQPSEPEKYRLSASPSSWSIDSNHIYISDWISAGGPSIMRIPGLWRYNTDGTGMALLPVVDGDGTSIFNKAAAPWRDATGKIMYLFSPPETGIDPYSPFSLVRADADGVSNRVVLRPETFHVTDASLWAPDGSAVIIIQNDGKSNRFANLVLIPVDASQPVVTILADASTLGRVLRWGP